jgi:hypothetical protein
MEESARKTEWADRLIDVWQTAVFWSLLAQYLQGPQTERDSVAENLATERVGRDLRAENINDFASLGGDSWVENEGSGTVRKLDRLSGLFSVA